MAQSFNKLKHNSFIIKFIKKINKWNKKKLYLMLNVIDI